METHIWLIKLSITLWLLVLSEHRVFAVNCTWSSWSSCSVVDCGIGTRVRQLFNPATNDSQQCTGSSLQAEFCTVTPCTVMDVVVFGAKAVQSGVDGDRVVDRAIDPIPAIPTIPGYMPLACLANLCASTGPMAYPWFRIELVDAHLVSRVQVVAYGTSSHNVDVRVGDSLTNNGNNNQLCGMLPRAGRYPDNTRIKWRVTHCDRPLWGKYINFLRKEVDRAIEFCRAAFDYELAIGIVDNSSHVEGRNWTVDEGEGLPNPIDCAMSPGVTANNALLTWKHNVTNEIPTYTSGQRPTANVYQVYENNKQRLYIVSAVGPASGVYSCHYALDVINSTSFTLIMRFLLLSCNLSVDTYDTSRVNVSVSCPADENSAITEYRIQFRNPPVASWQSRRFNATTHQPFVINGLETYTTYILRATASDGQGNVLHTGTTVVTTAEDNPGSPNSATSSGSSSSWVAMSWSLPSITNGIPRYYLVYYGRAGPSQVDASKLAAVNATGTSANLTLLSPFTWYRIEVAAVNIRAHDGKIIEGERSSPVFVQTKEDVPTTEPTALRFVPHPPDAITVSWTEPEVPNGIVRYYIVGYTPDDRSASTTVISPVRETTTSISGLTPSKKYIVTVRAVTVESGPAASLTVNSIAITPTAPFNATVLRATSTYLLVTWNPPTGINGVFQYYTMYHKTFTGTVFEKSDPIPLASYNLSGLISYTEYSIYVTVTNNAAVDAESEGSAVVASRTVASLPREPQTPSFIDLLQQSATTTTFIAPAVDVSNGPVRYVDVVIHRSNSGSFSVSPSALPSAVGPYADGSVWYVAVRYTYGEYVAEVAGDQFTVGSGLIKSIGGSRYRNVPLKHGQLYSIYLRVIGVDYYGEEVSSVSRPLIYETPDKTSDFSVSAAVMAGPAVAGAVCLLVIVVIFLVVRYRDTGTANYSTEQQSELLADPVALTGSAAHNKVASASEDTADSDNRSEAEGEMRTSTMSYGTASATAHTIESSF